MTKQEAAIKYITENYLDYRRLRHDIVADKLQVRVAHSLEDAALSGYSLEFKGGEYWREMTKHDINSIVCHCAQEYDANITSREVMTALQSDLIPDVHPLREYVLSCGEWTEEQPDWIDFVASQVTVKITTISTTCKAPQKAGFFGDPAAINSLPRLWKTILHHPTQLYPTLHQARTPFGMSASKNGLWRWWRVG